MRSGLIAGAAFVSLLAPLAAGAAGAVDSAPVLLAIDAEFGVPSSTSAQAVLRGAQLAADEINAAGGVLGGRRLEIIVRNNNSVPARSAENLQELAANPKVVAIMSGKYSPVVQEVLPLIHELGVPYLVPWAAADDLTRHPQRPNYVFRLSTTDSWALARMIESAVQRGHRRLGLLLPNSGWGRSSLAAARKAAGRTQAQLLPEQWFNFGDMQFGVQYDALRRGGAQALLLVANEGEGSLVVREIAGRPPGERLPVYSHWGVTGGHFFELTKGALPEVDFRVVQTFSFIGAQGASAQHVVGALKKQGLIRSARQIESPVGVAHAYDLTHLLARAIVQAGRVDRAAIRDALERLPEYRGLVRHYKSPFTPERHEALDSSVVFMARYDADGAIVRAR